MLQDVTPPPSATSFTRTPRACGQEQTELFFKTKICTFWLKGRCDRQPCSFAHGQDELLRAPDLTKTAMCRNVVLKGRCRDADCKYAHSHLELRTVSNLVPSFAATCPQTIDLVSNGGQEESDPFLIPGEGADGGECILERGVDWRGRDGRKRSFTSGGSTTDSANSKPLMHAQSDRFGISDTDCSSDECDEQTASVSDRSEIDIGRSPIADEQKGRQMTAPMLTPQSPPPRPGVAAAQQCGHGDGQLACGPMGEFLGFMMMAMLVPAQEPCGGQWLSSAPTVTNLPLTVRLDEAPPVAMQCSFDRMKQLAPEEQAYILKCSQPDLYED
jgi:hypothetical protein